MDEMKVIGYKVLKILGCMKIIFLLLPPNFFVTECIPSIQSFVSLYSTKARVGKKVQKVQLTQKSNFWLSRRLLHSSRTFRSGSSFWSFYRNANSIASLDFYSRILIISLNVLCQRPQSLIADFYGRQYCSSSRYSSRAGGWNNRDMELK